MQILYYRSRRRFGPPPRKLALQPAQPANLAWKPPPYPVLRRGNWQRRVQRRRLLYPVPNAPVVTGAPFGGAATKFLYYVSRRPKYNRPTTRLPAIPPATAPGPAFGGAPTKFLYYVSRRRLRMSTNYSHRYAIVASTPPPVTGNIDSPSFLSAMENFGRMGSFGAR